MNAKLPAFALRTLAGLSVALLFGACASFDAKWNGAAGKTGDTVTRWEGRWTSAKHHTLTGGTEGGRLRCVLIKQDPRHVLAHFHANYLCFSANYSVTLESKPEDPKTRFRGTQELPKIFGGTYWYDAQITKKSFKATYDSAYDKGVFDLYPLKSAP